MQQPPDRPSDAIWRIDPVLAQTKLSYRQTRHVFAYSITARDTVEQTVLELQSREKNLADLIISVDSSLINKLGQEDLEWLLSQF